MQNDELNLQNDTEDFLSSDDAPQRVPADIGHNLRQISDMKPRQLAGSIMAVYRELGGDAWLFEQARENPKEFLSILKTILPKNIDLNVDQDVRVLIASRQLEKMDTTSAIEAIIDNEVSRVTIQ